MPYGHDREFYKLQYPPEAAPPFIDSGVIHRVVDIGEGGFRYAPSDGQGPVAGSQVKGILEFPEDDAVEVQGTVVRIQAGEVAAHCAARGIPLAVVLREQRRLRRRYPFRT